MPRSPSFTRTDVAEAALALIDRQGLAALSMRAVAGELGVGTMSLYRYVEDREQLERLVVDLILGAVALELPARTSWTRRLTLLSERVRQAVAEHPSVVPLLLTHRHSSQGVLRWAEATLGVLTDAGFSGRQRVIALRTLLAFLLGALQAEHLGPLSGEGTATMAELPASTYPLLAETARLGRRVSPDEEFHGGLEVVLRGLEADLLG